MNRQSQFGRTGSYGALSASTTPSLMARLAFRASIAPALALRADDGGDRGARCGQGTGRRAAGRIVRSHFRRQRAPERRRQRARGGAACAQDRTAQVSGSDLLLRLDRLEAQIRQLTGVVEQLQHRNQQLEAYIRRMQEDSEHGSRSSAPGARRARSVPPRSRQRRNRYPRRSAGRRGDAFDPSQHPNAPGAPQTLGSIDSASARRPLLAIQATRRSARPAGARPAARSTLRRCRLRAVRCRRPRRRAIRAPAARMPQRSRRHSCRKTSSISPTATCCARTTLSPRRAFATSSAGIPATGWQAMPTFWLGESLFQRQLYRDAAETFLNVSTKYRIRHQGA